MKDKKTLAQVLTGKTEDLEHLAAVRPRPWNVAVAGAGTPDRYDMDDTGLLKAAMLAFTLGQPLILAGEPGVGKTEFAEAFAQRIGLSFHQPIAVKTSSQGKDLFYHFDEVARFRDATEKGKEDQKPLASYVRFQALGRAILWSAGPDTLVDSDSLPLAKVGGEALKDRGKVPLKELFPKEFTRILPVEKRTASVVLVDEFDKAQRDAPNDILFELGRMKFRIDELGLEIAADPDHWPFVVFTSNSEREFPDAFLRRCVFHWINFPEEERLRRIVLLHSIFDGNQLDADSPLLRTSVRMFRALRTLDLTKKPATAELIAFVNALLQFGKGRGDVPGPTDPAVDRALGIMVKTRVDLDRCRKLLASPDWEKAVPREGPA